MALKNSRSVASTTSRNDSGAWKDKGRLGMRVRDIKHDFGPKSGRLGMRVRDIKRNVCPKTGSLGMTVRDKSVMFVPKQVV